MLFAAFTAAYMIRSKGSDWGHVRLPRTLVISTTLVVLSAVTLELARRKESRRWLLATIGLGFAFLVAQAVAWVQLSATGVFSPSHPHCSFFYLLTGVHGVHVFGGLGALLWVAYRNYTPRVAAAFWHFMGGLWIYVLVMLNSF